MGIALFHTGIRFRNTANLGNNERTDNRLGNKGNVLIKIKFFSIFHLIPELVTLQKNSHPHR